MDRLPISAGMLEVADPNRRSLESVKPEEPSKAFGGLDKQSLQFLQFVSENTSSHKFSEGALVDREPEDKDSLLKNHKLTLANARLALEIQISEFSSPTSQCQVDTVIDKCRVHSESTSNGGPFIENP